MHGFPRLLMFAFVLSMTGALSSPPQETPPSSEPLRRIPLHGTLNTRDLGGYSTDDGRRVRWGLLFRSDDLSSLDDFDTRRLRSLGLRRITDLRTDDERRSAPDVLPVFDGAPTYRSLSMVVPGTDVRALVRRLYEGRLADEELRVLTDRRQFVRSPLLRARMGEWIRSLIEPDALPQLFHCTGGKDRTGIGAAFVLLALGVPRAQVMEDFLLSNRYLSPSIERTIERIARHAEKPIDEAGLRAVLGVDRHSLAQVFEAIDADYGSTERFLDRGLGVDADVRERLRARLLESHDRTLTPAPPARTR
ncbi:MAG: tyrosine-protein phosphatase [Myxococcota bacterium]